MKKLFLILMLAFCTMTFTHTASARCCGNTCFKCKVFVNDCDQKCHCQSTNETPLTKKRITDSLVQHREFVIKSVWEAHMLPSMMMMTAQISAAATQQALVIGSFFDAKHQMETQRELQSLQAEAHSDYQVSEGVCEFGTLMRSLSSTNREKELTQVALSDYHSQRQMLNGDGIGGQGRSGDLLTRFNQYKTMYCNPNDLSGGLDEFCTNEDANNMNKDINFARVYMQKNFDIDFMDNTSTPDEMDFISLQSYIYGHRLLPRIPPDKMRNDEGKLIYSGANLYAKMRAFQGERSVAQAPFAAFAGARAATEASVQPYFEAHLKNMGIQEGDLMARIGEKPSYHSQMYLLANKMYQSPKFYVDLYDKPELPLD